MLLPDACPSRAYTELTLGCPCACSTPACLQRRLLAGTSAWGAGMAHWLLWAYCLEFLGWRVHLGVWGAGLAFLAAHVWLLWELITAWRLGAGSGAQQPAAKHKLQ